MLEGKGGCLGGLNDEAWSWVGCRWMLSQALCHMLVQIVMIIKQLLDAQVVLFPAKIQSILRLFGGII
jgi:hypothetical protein